MDTAEEKYMNDPMYRAMVETLTYLIAKGDFTPSELREMVIFACTRYEMMHLEKRVIRPCYDEIMTHVQQEPPR